MAGHIYSYHGESSHSREVRGSGRKLRIGWPKLMRKKSGKWWTDLNFFENETPRFWYQNPMGRTESGTVMDLDGYVCAQESKRLDYLTDNLEKRWTTFMEETKCEIVAYLGGFKQTKFMHLKKRDPDKWMHRFWLSVRTFSMCDVAFDAMSAFGIDTPEMLAVRQYSALRPGRVWGETVPKSELLSGWKNINIAAVSNGWNRWVQRDRERVGIEFSKINGTRYCLIAGTDIQKLHPDKRINWISRRLEEDYDVAFNLDYARKVGATIRDILP
jgi:hypothetical protein